ncbi:hypothetical protein E3Q06_03529 [Wallemia mellicola]|uniref:Zn(2)-C6 fungal-type domain-containing protein n=2 Tax=Wallemia mellicola TaxID=1708541 RepID=A0AB74K9M2_9BASI|nr:hypothetical protein E3Q24_01735 [Wallemia mellicola]TIB82020.1 hypothetical protein E3Q21_03533 [Wallemia mellicola]TIB84422.1 hypothetical protein E3Q20_03677 [Wallemia mellicola]TIC21348.1 hypothetical protein E3Q12_03477 [Wallemia mellicola]TIC33064.1 hypothetical protein E3Q09_03492 [Wallemia mellicola]
MTTIKAKRIACLNCRNSKVKCVSTTDQLPCERCTKIGLDCQWQLSSKKMGRPTKKTDNYDCFTLFAHGVPLIDGKTVCEDLDLVYYSALTISDNLRGLDPRNRRASMINAADEAIKSQKRDLRTLIGLIYTIHDDYGRNDITLAQDHIQYASRVALELGLNTKTPFLTPGDRLNSIYGRIWWELYILDVFLNLSTSGTVTRQFDSYMTISVDIDDVASDINLQQAYDSRIKAVSILNECTKVNGRLNFERVSALDKILVNLLTVARSNYHSAIDKTIEELNFTSILILLAARIHLHRQAWFSDMTFNFQSCAFNHKMKEMEMLLDDAFVMPASCNLEDSLSGSLTAIHECTEQMLHYIRLDETHQTQQGILIPPHWPFYSCCQLVASYGPILEIALLNAIRAGEQGALQNMTMDPSSVWKTRVALSNVDLTYATLTRYMSVWKVAQIYREEVAVCRKIIDSCETDIFGI